MNRSRLRAAIIIAALIGIVVIVLIVLYNIHKKPNVSLRATNLGYSVANQIVGEDVYSYNGLMFSRTSTKSGKVEVLSTGVKLPPLSYAQWVGDKGIIVAFQEESYINSLPWKVLLKQGLSYNDLTSEFLWYLRFSDNSLRRLDTTTPKQGASYYSEKAGGVFYLSNSENDEGGSELSMQLRFFSPKTLKTNIVLKDAYFSYANFLAMDACQDYAVCLFGIALDNTSKVFGVSGTESAREITNHSGYLLPTNNPDVFSLAEDRKYSGGEDELVTLSLALLDTNTGEITSTNGTTNSFSTRAALAEDDTFYAIAPGAKTDGYGTSFYLGGDNVFGRKRTTVSHLKVDDQDYKDVVTRISLGSNGDMLMSDDQNKTYLVDLNNNAQWPKDSLSAAKGSVDACKRYTKLVDYYDDARLFKVYFNDDNTFDMSVRNFSKCLINTGADNTVLYQFYFGGLSALNGRFTTD